MCDYSCPPTNLLSAETYINLELAKEAAHAYAYENGFAIAVQRSAKWGRPPCIRKVWMRCEQGGLHRMLSSEETRSQTKVNKKWVVLT